MIRLINPSHRRTLHYNYAEQLLSAVVAKLVAKPGQRTKARFAQQKREQAPNSVKIFAANIATTAERMRCKSIHELATEFDDGAKLAAEAIESGMTVAQFQAAIATRRIMLNPLMKVSGEQKSLFNPGRPTTMEELESRLRAEYQQHRNSGITNDAYVAREINKLCNGDREDPEILRRLAASH